MAVSIIKKISAGILSAAIVTLSTAGNLAPESLAAAPDEYHDDWLHVNENAEIVDMNGNPV